MILVLGRFEAPHFFMSARQEMDLPNAMVSYACDRHKKEDDMQYLDIIQSSLDYIEENLSTELTAQELGQKAGFSLFHYYRLFQDAVGMPVMQYITKRRLLWAIWEMSAGTAQIDAALRWGFDTSAGFYKAFRKEFDCSPTAFLTRYPVRKPCPICLNKEEHIMITKKRVRDALCAWGMEQEAIHSIVFPSGHVSENTFRVGEDRFIKAYTVPAKAENNAEILSALHTAGLSHSVPIPAKSGDLWITSGEFTWLMTGKLPGEPLSVNALFAPGGEALARYLGEIIGQLHLVLQKNNSIVCNERNIFEEVRDQWLMPAKVAMQLPESFCREYLETFGALQSALPVQIIHRDPNPNNIILQDGKLTGFIDFELSQRSIRLFDPCYAATGILVESGAFTGNDLEMRKRWLTLCREILRGYDAAVHLTEAEKQSIPYVIFSIQLICVGYFCGEEKFSDLAKVNMQMLRWLMEQRKALEF